MCEPNERFYCGKYQSIDIERGIEKFESFDEFEKAYPQAMLEDDNRVGYYLQRLIFIHDVKDSVLSVEAGLNMSYVGNIINGRRNSPSRDVLLRICLAMHASFDETQHLLKYAGVAPLYVRRRDVIIWYGLIKGMGLDEVNEDIKKRGITPLYREKTN